LELVACAPPADTRASCSLIARASHSNNTQVRPSPINDTNINYYKAVLADNAPIPWDEMPGGLTPTKYLPAYV
jgi:hypothetical protein